MKKVSLKIQITILLIYIIFASQSILNAQTTYVFQVAQSQNALTADAGPDKMFDGSNTVMLGGNPSATGGSGAYTYQWDNAQYLNNAIIENPTVTNLVSPTLFTLEVNDGSCSKQSQVFVDYVSGVLENANQNVEIFPNPFKQIITIRSENFISEITMKDISGKKILVQRKGLNGSINIDTSDIPEGIYFVSILFSNGSILTKRLCKTSYN